ncbi:MAG: co-chaperone GroES [Euryarchaeota archaeon]|jgi:co-chaperonin GroES (HSP10)|nr:co-chaperone GroES [Euryarchaeota archaeon]
MGKEQQYVLKPIGDQIALIRDEIVEKTESGIILQEGRRVVPGSGTVFAIGSYVEEVKEGDRVYFSAMAVAKAGRTIEVEGQEFLIIKEEDLYCTVTPTVKLPELSLVPSEEYEP